MDTVLSLMALGIVALLLGALALWRRGLRRQAQLMLLLAAVLAGNIALLVVPDEQGQSLANTAPR